MCFGKPPKPPPKPVVPSVIDQSVNAEDMVRKRLIGSQNRTTNILSSPLGDPNYGKTSQRTNVMGV